jgi:predicted TPR repeat methyltransferase
MQDARITSNTSGKNTALIATEVANSQAYTQIVNQLRFADTKVHKTTFIHIILAGTTLDLVTLSSVTIRKPNGKPLTG